MQISHEWRGGFYTINVTAAGKDHLVDYQRGGRLWNCRCPLFTGPDLSFGFSFNPATPRIASAIRDRILQRYDTELMAVANTGAFPKSFSALGAETFFYDAPKTRVYVWLPDGESPAGGVEIKAPALVHDAIALLRLDGSEARLVAHHYSLDAERQYQAMPKATISPDGKLIIFSSNMNDRDGRVDVFAFEVPTR